ncbi:A-kinase anchor protein 17A [Drosophila sulfurigaster albostrigata]|uniref:A-kinase anchor protein 17A n=1 Tax=Drosophila sulfurigaster albostrigata TaxID=89887 RepID=UPI002D218399|nr:A-kinase anchor protein 17A [Drosophila sulfurigaster albostrigata]
MINIQTIENVADCSPLYLPHSLYLKPLAKMQISVALPEKIKTGKSVSNLEIMEKLSAELKPDKFLVLKVSKSTVNYIRFEAELDERKRLRLAIERLDGVSLRLSGFNEAFRVRCTEAKDEFPTRHDWDSYFRDARNMDEMKAGERPDTIHLTHLPIRWFCPRHSEHEEQVKPSESIFKRIFEKFGRVRAVDIPICDPYRKSMQSDISGMRTFSFEQDVLFEAYVQFEEYSSFVRAMDEFRSTKMVRKFVDKTQAININVNFDKQKHLSDSHVQRRERMRKRCVAKAQAEDEEREREKQKQIELAERERQKQDQLKLAELEKQREREEKRKEKHLKKIQERGQVEISQKIRVEERKLMIAQRKLESIRILEQVFERIQLKQKEKSHRGHHDDAKDVQRGRLVEKYKTATEKLVCDQRKIVQEIKSNTPLMGLLKSKSKKSGGTAASSEEEGESSAVNKKAKLNGNIVAANGNASTAAPAVQPGVLNPFKAVTAALAAGAVPGTAAAAAYSAEAASEWMQSLSMFGYGMPPVFPGAALYRPPAAPPFPVSSNYRGFAPRPRGRGRGRGRGGRAGYDGHSSSYYNPNHYDGDEGDDGYYHKSSRGRNRSRSSSYSRSRSRSRGRRLICRSRRSRSRSRSRSNYRKSSYSSRSRRSHSRSRSHSHSRSRSHSPAQRKNRKLASTRRSRTTSYSRSRSRTRSRRSNSRRERRLRSRSRSRSRSNSSKRVVLEADKLVASAEKIQRTIEQHTKDRMREEVREIKQNFRHQRTSSSTLQDNHMDNDGDALHTSARELDGDGNKRSSRRNSLVT